MSPQTSPKLIASASVPWTEFSHGPRFGIRYRALSDALLGENHHVGVAIEELDPGRQSNPAHYHFFEEEHVYILEGALTLRLGAQTHEMQAGDYVCFPAGQKAGHCLINAGEKTCRYLIVGERNPNDVAVYTDSRKVLVRSLGRRAVLDLDPTRDYWHGEDTSLGEPPAGQLISISAEPPVAPKPPISSGDVEWTIEGTGPRFGGRSRHLTDAAVGRDYHIGMLIESPAPGMRLAPKHYHMLEEEHALILDGEVTLLYGDERHVLKPGDYVCFPAGERVGHSFLNSGSGPCSYLMIGEHNPNEVCVYPDSNKIMVRALNTERDIFDMAAVRRYWDGEEAE